MAGVGFQPFPFLAMGARRNALKTHITASKNAKRSILKPKSKTGSFTKGMDKHKPYSIQNLIDSISEHYNDYGQSFNRYQVDFTDAVAFVTGWVYSEWTVEHLSFTEPPIWIKVSQSASFDYVLVSYDNGDGYLLSNNELYYMEDRLSE